ncbi:MAG: VWA domain-containing protein [Thermoanaerobaculia bacterium]
MSFAAPQLLWIVAASPLMALAAAWVWRRHLAALRAWAESGLWPRLGLQPGPGRWWLSALLLALAALAAGLGLARPRWGQHEETVTRRGLDIVVVLDTSLSMVAQDVRPNRLFVATSVARRLAAALPGSRLALVQTEGESLVLSPLTVDVAMLDLLLDPLEPGTLPSPGTWLTPALNEAARLLPAGAGRGRAVVVLSDGEDHGGRVAEAAESLAAEGIRVFAVGIGTLEGAPLPVGGDGEVEYKRTADDRVVISRLDEPMLEQLTRITGGRYLRAAHAGTDLHELVGGLGELARGEARDTVVESGAERFQWPLAVAILTLGLWLLLPPFRESPA